MRAHERVCVFIHPCWRLNNLLSARYYVTKVKQRKWRWLRCKCAQQRCCSCDQVAPAARCALTRARHDSSACCLHHRRLRRRSSCSCIQMLRSKVRRKSSRSRSIGLELANRHDLVSYSTMFQPLISNVIIRQNTTYPCYKTQIR